MHLRISRWTPIALKRCIFDLKYGHNYMKKEHFAWKVPWTSSQLFVCRLNEKSIPGLWIQKKPPFLSNESPIAIVFTLWKQANKQTKKIHKGNSLVDIFITTDCKGLRCQFLIDTSQWVASRAKPPPHPPPMLLTSVFTNKLSSPSLHPQPSQKSHPFASRRSNLDSHV